MPTGVYTRTIEMRNKISLGGKGKKLSESHRLNISKGSIGKKGTYGHKGKKHTEETRQKIVNALKKRFPNGRKHSIETRLKMKESAKKGKDSHSWKGGITDINKHIRNSFEYKIWRTAVFERDNYTCIWCGFHGSKGKLNADHIKPFAAFPELRFAIDNGRTLCEECHSTTDSYKGKFLKNYKHTIK
jgi:hypothetical protein